MCLFLFKMNIIKYHFVAFEAEQIIDLQVYNFVRNIVFDLQNVVFLSFVTEMNVEL